MNHEQILDNQAVFQTKDQCAQENTCFNCEETLVFALQNKHHQFSLGLLTVLQCLKFAETQGHIPQLPSEWWLQIQRRYG